MIVSRYLHHGIAAACVAAIAVLFSPMPTGAQERTITAVSPAQVSQGDTVLLTIVGQDLPTGTVTVEFFPEQIALLDILSASDSRIEAQIKVPNLAPPGAYNILVYNHLGDEAFGQGLFSIISDILTPVFRNYDPKVIAQATAGFALLFTGEGITPQVVDHLSMQWQRAGGQGVDLESTFTAGGPGQILCAVTGQLPSGVLLGRVFLDGMPIYLVEITIESAAGLIIGHRPAEISVDGFPYEVTLLGADLTAAYISGLVIKLVSADTTARPRQVGLLDPASVMAAFNGPLPAGDYDLLVTRGETLLYGGRVSLTPPEVPQVDVPDEEPPAADAGEVPPPAEQPPAPPPATSDAGAPPFGIEAVLPQSIPAGDRPASLALTGSGMRTETLQGLTFELSVEGDTCGLLFLGAGGEACTCLFAAPEGGWLVGSRPRLTISDSAGGAPQFTADLDVTASAPPELETTLPEESPPPPDEGWRDTGEQSLFLSADGWAVAQAYVDESLSGNALVVVLSAPDASWDPALIDASFTLLPREIGVLECFANLSLDGQVTFRRSESGVPIGRYPGNFVAGDLLVRLTYDGGPTEVSSMPLEGPAPRARLAPSPVEYVRRDPQTGGLSPRSLRCVIEFSPLVVADPGFLQLEFTPPAAGDYATELRAEGTHVELDLSLAAWQTVEDWEEGLLVEVNSTYDLSWDGEPSIRIAVREAERAAPPPAVEILTAECTIHDRGFSLLLDPGNSELSAERFRLVEARSDHLLLDRNLSSFEVTAVESRSGEDRLLSLRFTRDATALDDLAYGLLMTELIEAETVQLDLVWPQVGAAASRTLRFVASSDEDVQDVLGELGLIAPE